MATAITPSFEKSAAAGTCREFWIKATGLVGLASAASKTVINTIENPYYEDLLIKEAILYVTTAMGDVVSDIDIGLGNDADGTGIGAEIADGMVSATLHAAGVKELGIVHAIAAPPVQPIWKAKGSSADSFICTAQTGNVDASALVANLLVKCIPVVDLT